MFFKFTFFSTGKTNSRRDGVTKSELATIAKQTAYNVSKVKIDDETEKDREEKFIKQN